MNVSSLGFNFADVELLHCYIVTAKTFELQAYLILQKQFIREIREINPT